MINNSTFLVTIIVGLLSLNIVLLLNDINKEKLKDIYYMYTNSFIIIHENGGNSSYYKTTIRNIPCIGKNDNNFRNKIIPRTREVKITHYLSNSEGEDQTKFIPREYNIFNDNLTLVKNGEELINGNIYYIIYKDEHPIWSPMYEGYLRENVYQNYSLRTISLKPRIFLIENFLDDEEIKNIIKIGQKKTWDKSQIYTSNGNINSSSRNSNQTWIRKEDDNFIIKIDNRIKGIVRIEDDDLQEPLQLLKYNEKGYYYAHHDTFNQNIYSNDTNIQRGQQRLLTFFIYLNDVEEGGETVFLYGGERGYILNDENINYKDCTKGFKVKPKKGSAILWYNLFPNDNIKNPIIDPYHLHAGCPPIKGKKLAINKWIKNKV